MVSMGNRNIESVESMSKERHTDRQTDRQTETETDRFILTGMVSDGAVTVASNGFLKT